MPECVKKKDITHSVSCSQLFSTIYWYTYLCNLRNLWRTVFHTAYLIWKYIQPFIFLHTEGLVLQTKLLKRSFQTHFFWIYIRHREMFGGFYSQIRFTLHEFKLLQSTRSVLCSFTISSHKATSCRRISDVSADDTNLSVCTCACIHVLKEN